MPEKRRPFLTRRELESMIADFAGAKRDVREQVAFMVQTIEVLMGMHDAMLEGLGEALAEIERLKAESN